MAVSRDVFLAKLDLLQNKYMVTDTELAAKLGITAQAISNWRTRTDRATVSQGTIFNVCEAFGINASYFYEEEAE